MIATQMLGLARCRYILRPPRVARLSRETLVNRMAPTIGRHITGRLGGATAASAAAAMNGGRRAARTL